MYNPTQSTPLSIDPTLDVAKPVSVSGKKKNEAKRKTSPSKPKTKKREKVDTSYQKESIKEILNKSSHRLTPPSHSSEVPIGVSIAYADTHEDSPYNRPSPSQQGDASVEHSSLHLPGTHPQVMSHIPPFSSTHARSEIPLSGPKRSTTGVVPPTSKDTASLIPGSGKGRPGFTDEG